MDEQSPNDVLPPEEKQRFEMLVLPHLDAALNLARWLLGDRSDAEDVAQEAMLRAYRFFRTFRGTEARAWLLQIVRNRCYTWMQKNRKDVNEEFEEEFFPDSTTSPEAAATQADERQRLTAALESLPPRSREIIVLRELEGCSYKEIAEIMKVPIGTVMSTLARTRERLQKILSADTVKETP